MNFMLFFCALKKISTALIYQSSFFLVSDIIKEMENFLRKYLKEKWNFLHSYIRNEAV